MRISESFKDELLDRADLVDLIGTYLTLKKSGSSFKGLCPFHEEKTPSFTVFPNSQYYKCFGCGASGNAISFIIDFEGLGFVDAVEELASRYGLEIPKDTSPQQQRSPAIQVSDYAILATASHYFQQQLRSHPDAAKAVNYLKQRGLSGETCARFGVGYAPPGWRGLLDYFSTQNVTAEQAKDAGLVIFGDSQNYYDRFRDRIIFPIRDKRGRVVGFGGRIIDEGNPKYLNSPETPLFHKGRILYGLYEVRKAQAHPQSLVVVEGYMDVAMLAQHGINNAVATLGTAVTPDHLIDLFRSTKHVIFCFDGDTAGRQAAEKACKVALRFIREDKQVSLLHLADGEDPDSLVRKIGCAAFEQQVQQSTPLADYLIKIVSQGSNLSSLEGRRVMLEKARPLIQETASPLFRKLLVERLAKLANLEEKYLLNEMAGNNAVAGSSDIRRKPEVRLSLIDLIHSSLLRHPELYRLIGSTEHWQNMQDPRLQFLLKTLAIIQLSPGMSASQLLERWRGAEEFDQVREFMVQTLLDTESQNEAEFKGALVQLERRVGEHLLSELLEKSRHSALSSEEKKQLNQLLSLNK